MNLNRTFWRQCVMLLVGVWLLTACTPSPAVPTALPPTVTPSPVATSVAMATAVSPTNTPLLQLAATEAAANTVRELTILYTNDEHGWMAGVTPGQGAANLMGLWRTAHGYQPDGPFLVLSGGDMWTGPAISTWFDGRSMVEVMNSMGYAAAAVGNHEFDFGLDALRQRAAESGFPFLSANIRRVADGSIPEDVGIRPFTIVTVNGIQVGLIGLTTRRTPTTTNPSNVVDFEFIPYEEALREMVPQVRAAGAQLIIVPAHICQDELAQLAVDVADLGIALLGGGHCNQLFAQETAASILLSGGSSMASYAYATLSFDTTSNTIVDATVGTRANMNAPADPVVEAIVTDWQATTNDELNVVIGYSERGLERRSAAMQALVVASWLHAYPTADVAISNLGGMRAALPAGDISLADIVTVLPFNNVIVDVTMSGEQLLQLLFVARGEAIGGVRLGRTDWILTRTGDPIDPAATYHVLVNDFMYAGGDDYTMLAEFDPHAYDTGIDWRQPVIDWIIEQESTAVRPLDAAIAALGGN